MEPDSACADDIDRANGTHAHCGGPVGLHGGLDLLVEGERRRGGVRAVLVSPEVVVAQLRQGARQLVAAAGEEGGTRLSNTLILLRCVVWVLHAVMHKAPLLFLEHLELGELCMYL